VKSLLSTTVAVLFAGGVLSGAASNGQDRPAVGSGQPTAPLVVTHATLWTPLGAHPDHELVVVEGVIVAVGPSGKLERPRGARLVDAGGDTLLPGLVDAHIHLVFGAELPKGFADAPRTSLYPATGRQLLRSGVTAGRVHLWGLGDGPAFARDSRADRFPAPRLQFGGPGFMGGRPEWDSEKGNVWGVKDAADAARKVKRVADEGAEWIALHELTRFQPGELEVLVAEARRLGLGVMAAGDHVDQTTRAAALGADTIDYLDRSDAPLYPEALLTELKRRGEAVFMVPMIGFPHRYVAYRAGSTLLDEPRLTEFLPKDVASFVRQSLEKERTQPGQYAPKWTSVPPTLPGKFRQLRSAGLQVAVGTDCGSPGHVQADAIWWELDTWRQLGVPVREIVRAATITGASLLRRNDIGRLEPGARGDLLLYRGKIEDGPLGVDRVRLVAKGGLVYVDEGRWVEP
jgi:imidazolonepropionase-like amidohydrolase